MRSSDDPGEGGGPPAAGRRGRLDRSALGRLPSPPGLCADCLHLELQASKRSVFVRCGLSDADRRFPRYPRLPVAACAGHEPDFRSDRRSTSGDTAKDR